MAEVFEWDGICPMGYFGQTSSTSAGSVSTFKKAQNATVAAVKVAKAVVKREPVKVSQEVVLERTEICRDCEFFNDANSECNQCGCFIPWKTELATEGCPIGKWGIEKKQGCGGCGQGKSPDS